MSLRFIDSFKLKWDVFLQIVTTMMMIDDDFRTVVISYSAEGSISSDNRDDYPYFFRTIAENKQYK